ncbi:RICIN domain-containing protein [Streptomyces telluris]|uniref:RICIN domain-containing protein n=1 Tax=Streptomyces telluris TaxID=2720021 RepID=A0A9X2LH95_9ACTN|nr:RICIN domain-containing protein [Streptomyces telluris]MCQ8771128.1 RICIN domain-containing protein [Streptomyces telluris]
MNRTVKRAAKLFTAPAAALALLLPVLAVTATPAAAAATDAYTFTNTDGTLNATGNRDGNQISVTPDGTNYTNWRLIKLSAPGTFNIASTSSGKCIYASQPAVQQSCGKDGEQWHFRPVDGKPNAFGIVRRDDSSGTEYCMDNRGGLHLWGILAQPNACNGSASQEWTVPASKAAEAKGLALDYYADLCAKKTSTCSWTQKSEGQPEVLPRQPASSVWYNDTSGTMKQVFTTIYHSGWAQSYSVGLSSSVGVSTPVQAMIANQLTATQTYQSDETTVNGIAIDVPSKHYGWVDFAAVGKKVTGTWTFNTDNQPWTTDATVTVPVINSAVGSTMYVARTSTDAPGSGTSSTDVKPAALAKTAKATMDVPAGGKLTAHNGSVQVSDAGGSTIATVQPGTVTDTNGTTHKVSLSVDGNTVTQTVEGVTGDTITGTITPPTYSLGGGTSAAAEKAVKSMTSAKSFLAAPASAPKNSDEHDKCMAKKIGTSIVVSGAMGALAGPEGVAIGMLRGAFTGIAKGVIEC